MLSPPAAERSECTAAVFVNGDRPIATDRVAPFGELIASLQGAFMKPFRAVALICMFALGGANARSEQTTIGYHKEEALRLPVGEARIRYRYIGEPVSNPARLAISIQCLNTDKERLLEELTICDWKGYRYDHALKSLMINLVYGRVDQETGQSYCDHDRAAQILVDVCQRPSSRGADN